MTARRVLMVGVSQKTAPIALRDRLARAAESFATARRPGGVDELVALSTCHRLELYALVDDVEAASRDLIVQLARAAGVPVPRLASAAEVLTEDAAVLHLCRVAAGLDSPILGEPQILGQVRKAPGTSGASGPLLDRVFAAAIRAGRRVRNETGLGESRGALAAVAATVAADELGDLSGRRVLVIGAGAMGELIVDRFDAAGCDLVVVSRSEDRAARIAARVGGCAACLERVAAELARVDIVVSCTRSPGFVVSVDEVAAARAGTQSPALLLDLALPRDIDPAAASVPGCRLYDLDRLHAEAGSESRAPSARLADAEAIARQEAARFDAWRRSRDAAPAITSLRRRAEEIRVRELARMEPKLSTLDFDQRRAVEMVTTQIVNKLLHAPTIRVKDQAGDELAPVLCELFALGDAA